MHMSDYILTPGLDHNPFEQSNQQLPQDFWERYFAIQKITTMVEMQDGSFMVEIKDEKTGKVNKFDNVRFATRQGWKTN